MKKIKTEVFQEFVQSKYELYNGLFMSLPFDGVRQTGMLLPVFEESCKKGFQKNQRPDEIVEEFFFSHCAHFTKEEKISLLFRFIQYVERQIVLFDALEDAAFSEVNNTSGVGSLSGLVEQSQSNNQMAELATFLQDFKVRLIFTAHPTQFYPSSVLGIITDLEEAIKKDEVKEIRQLLSQLGKTPFYSHYKPTPYEEALRLIWYLENVFYDAFGSVNQELGNIQSFKQELARFIIIGFWPCGDRDGNPHVTSEMTEKVSDQLRRTICKKYHQDLRKLKRKLTFKQIDEKVARLCSQMESAEINGEITISLEDLTSELSEIRSMLKRSNSGLYIENLNDLLNKVHLFGYHFASMDIRQDSRVHEAAFNQLIQSWMDSGHCSLPKNYFELPANDRLDHISGLRIDPNLVELVKDDQSREVYRTIRAIPEIRSRNGDESISRYIISNTQSANHVLELLVMLSINDGKSHNELDIVPLFETISDLKNAKSIMHQLYSNDHYVHHLNARGRTQTIMLGFSDGTKDGGYLQANWSIFKAKEELTQLSAQFGIDVLFFDGRGGPPARGGGESHRFYASMGPTIASKEIQLTIQGQTISSNFGTQQSASFNVEQLLSAGCFNAISKDNNALNESMRQTFDELAHSSYKSYCELKNHPSFVPYLEEVSPLRFYGKTNIGSRPVKRSGNAQLNLSDLRAIPFVGSWSQLKQNVPGYYGVGTAIQQLADSDRIDEVILLYRKSGYFRTLIDNCMMALSKTFFSLTEYLSQDENFGEFWKLIHDEFLLTRHWVLYLSGFDSLMDNLPAGKASIALRESIVLPLLTIQQYALIKLRNIDGEGDLLNTERSNYENMVTRSMIGNTNASRNSA